MPNEQVTSVLLGLIGALESNPKTPQTDDLVLRALAAEDGDAEGIVAELRVEKGRIAPGCAQCACPCGNTSDYDMRRMAPNTASGLRKRQILALLGQIGKAAGAVSEAGLATVYKALACLRYDWEDEAAAATLAETQALWDGVRGQRPQPPLKGEAPCVSMAEGLVVSD